MCREEAAELSKLKPQFNTIPLYAVVHEVLDNEVDEFKKYFDGEVFLDGERKFYGPRERWQGVISGLVKPTVWGNIRRARRGNYEGNMKGEGRLLGGVFVIGNGEVLYDHQEKAFGDHANLDDVLAAVKKIAKK